MNEATDWGNRRVGGIFRRLEREREHGEGDYELTRNEQPSAMGILDAVDRRM